MRGHRLAGLVGVACVLCVVVGCSSAAMDRVGQERPYGPQPLDSAPAWPDRPGVTLGNQPSTWWPVSSVRELVPTGIEVVASSGVRGMVVDGVGSIWVDVSWGLVRLDPVTWSAMAWDAGDDVAFADKRFVRASGASGVWVVGKDQVRLFDGVRFVRDIHVPSEYLGEVSEGGQRVPESAEIQDLVEVGSELWIASVTGVARCDGYTWSMVGDGEGDPHGVEKLQLTPWGEVWAGTETGWGRARWTRYDGASWTPIDRPEGPGVRAFAWDPTGGIVATTGTEVMHYDGSSWQSLLRLGRQDYSDPVEVEAVAASGDGTVWVVAGGALLWSNREPGWHSITSPDGTSLGGLAVTGVDVVVSAGTGVYRVAGDELELVWSPYGRPALSTDIIDAVTVSGDAAWIVAADLSGDADQFYLEQVQAGRRHPALTRRLPAGAAQAHLTWASGGLGAAAVAASDGAIWYVTDDSVVRIAEGTESVVARRPLGAGLLAGDDGAVWLLPTARVPAWFADTEEGEPRDDADWEGLCLLTPDGQCAPSELPAPARDIMSLLVGAGGRLWATVCEGGTQPGGWGFPTCPGGWHLMRWDDGWMPVAYPGADVEGLGTSPGGGFWAILADTAGQASQGVLAHYRAGRWTSIPESADTDPDADSFHFAEVTPAGSVCTIDHRGPALVCADTTARISRTPLPMLGNLAVAADGAVWVWDFDAVARLPITVPD